MPEKCYSVFFLFSFVFRILVKTTLYHVSKVEQIQPKSKKYELFELFKNSYYHARIIPKI